MTQKMKVRAGLAVAAVVIAAGVYQQGPGRGAAAQAPTRMYPVFEVDTTWPQIPNNWVLGLVTQVAADSHDNVWIIHRPGTIPPQNQAKAAPPVLEFDPNGKFLQAWGGPATGTPPQYDWPDNPHGVTVDHKDNVWIAGCSPTGSSPSKRYDDMLLKFTNTGQFIAQIGGRDTGKRNQSKDSVHQATDVWVYPKTNEAFISDGYGNRRVLVLDADTLAFKRMWGAFGKPPVDPPGDGIGQQGGTDDWTEEGYPFFGGAVHAVVVSNDGIVYIADRTNHRVQLFTPEGKYLRQVFINRELQNRGSSAAGLALSADPEQQFLYVADWGNNHMVVLDRKSLEVLYQFGANNNQPGNFAGIHHIAADGKGNLYAAEVAPGARAQKFVFKGLSPTLPPNALSQQALLTGEPYGAFAGVNDLPNPYEIVNRANWGKMPKGQRWGSTSGVIVDHDGKSIWVYNRCGANSCAGSNMPAVLKFDENGNQLKAFGGGMTIFPHGFYLDKEGNIWLSDARGANEIEAARWPESKKLGHAVYKFSPDGKLLMTIGKPGTAGPAPDYLDEPSIITQAPNGDIFIGNGHLFNTDTGENRIDKFTKDGKYIKTIGKKGTGPDEWMQPHSFAWDSKGRLFVSDRRNMRLKVLDQEGNVLAITEDFGRISGLWMTSDDTLFAIDSETNPTNHPGWRKGIRIGSVKDIKNMKPRFFIPPHMLSRVPEGAIGEGVAVDAAGNVYVAEVTIMGVSKFVPRFKPPYRP